ncbi:MAG: DUF4910 domain-containing protein [Fidelibacterota bacterium]|nr:MAG: DUF4910 domain-containing protein [Candidatus Neomarinimicrobiota bacterium]
MAIKCSHSRRIRFTLFITAALLWLFVLAPRPIQAQADLLDPQLRDQLHEALSGETAKEHVIQITRHHRIQGSRGYRDAANYVLDELRAAGFKKKDAFIESFKSDGKVSYQTWQSPSGWDIDWAELRLLEPSEERLVGYPEIAMSLITYSNPGDLTAELVWVGSGTSASDYEGKDVRGKFVLATGYGGEVHRQAVLEHGAAAVVCYLDDERAQQYPDMLQYTGMWPRTEELKRVTFGFNITNRQGERLRSMLESGRKVVLRGQVKGTGLESYEMDIVVAVIRGAKHPDEELVFCAHLDHPKESANDNASGSAAILDIALTMNRLIDQGRLPRPERTLRFLWVPEWYGTMAYIDAHPEMVGPDLGGKVLANINLDMVGENLELLHSRLFITRSPASIPSMLSDVVANMAAMVDRMDIRTPRGSLSAFNYQVVPYGGGSDHMMFIDRKIPGIVFTHSDYTHHTSEDTPDKVDPVELERCEIIAAGTMLYLASLDEDQALDLAAWSAGQSMARLGEAVRRALATTDPYEAENIVNHALTWESTSLRSIERFHSSNGLTQRIRSFIPSLELQAQQASQLITARATTPSTPAADNRVPLRTTRGPLFYLLPESALPSEAAAWYSQEGRALTGPVRFELVNFIDGNRTVGEIRDLVAAEFDPIDQAVVSHFMEDLVRVGVLEWK